MERLREALEALQRLDLEKRTQAYREQTLQTIDQVTQRLHYETQEIRPKSLEALAILDEKTFTPLYKEFNETVEYIGDTLGFFQKEHRYFTPMTLGTGGIFGAGIAAGIFLGTGLLFPIIAAPLVGIGCAPAAKQAFLFFKTKHYLKRYEQFPERIETLRTLTNQLDSFIASQYERGEKFIPDFHEIYGSAKIALRKAMIVSDMYSTLGILYREMENPTLEKVMQTRL